MKHISIKLILISHIFFISCSDVGNVSNSSEPEKNIADLDDNNSTELLEDNMSNIGKIEDNNTDIEKPVVSDKNESEIIEKDTKPYVNPFQPNTDIDPNAPKYIKPVEPEKIYIGEKEVKTLSGIIDTDLVLSKTFYWQIRDKVEIKSQLSIEAGTTIFAENSQSKIIFLSGSTLLAIGSKIEPIIFTSKADIENKNPQYGNWGGIELIQTENSILKYVQIRFSGYNQPSLELENLKSNNILEYIQIYISNGNGISIKGGDINIRNSLIIGANGDSISLEDNWAGNIQNLYIHQLSGLFSDKSSGIEVDKSVENVMLSNITIVSNSDEVGAGIYLRDGGDIKIINSIILGKRAGSCIKAEILSDKHNFESNILGNCSDGHLQNIKIDTDLNFLTSEVISLNNLYKKIEPINPYSINSWFDDYPELYIGSFNYNSSRKWSDIWSVGMEDLSQ